MPSTEFEPVRQHEIAAWDALVRGDAEADARLLSDEFLGVYPSGFAGKSSHVGQLLDGPSVLRYELTQERLQSLAPGLVLMSYRAAFARLRPSGEAVDVMYVSSIWRRAGERWLNIFSQDTSAG